MTRAALSPQRQASESDNRILRHASTAISASHAFSGVSASSLRCFCLVWFSRASWLIRYCNSTRGPPQSIKPTSTRHQVPGYPNLSACWHTLPPNVTLCPLLSARTPVRPCVHVPRAPDLPCILWLCIRVPGCPVPGCPGTLCPCARLVSRCTPR